MFNNIHLNNSINKLYSVNFLLKAIQVNIFYICIKNKNDSESEDKNK